MPNIFGLVSESLTNPLTEDLLANDFNAFDFNEVHLNEIHDNTGTGNIVVHEQFNMTNNKITNVADPTQNKDAATKQYVDGAVVTPIVEYDLMAAYTDETTPIAAGALDMSFPIPTSFLLIYIKGFINQSATSNNFQVEVFRNAVSQGFISFLTGSTESDSISYVGGLTVSPNDRFTCSIPVADATATGLKLVFLGQQN